MALKCDICQKGIQRGQNIRHKHSGMWELKAPKTKKTWKPNIRQTDVNIDGTSKRINICMKCYKRMRMNSV